jgi:GNAT superfamily N-acetyltransferase
MTLHPLTARPLTPDRWTDIETLFQAKGCSFARGCWCMVYREVGTPVPPAGLSLAAFRKAALRDLAAGDPPPGLIGYDAADRPVGWVTVGPRPSFAKLQRSPVMKPVDAEPVWSIVCFVVPSPYRGQGVARALLDHAIRHARDQGASIVEAYPIDKPGRSQDQWLWHGVHSMFDRAGFQEVARRKPARPVMRLHLATSSG